MSNDQLVTVDFLREALATVLAEHKRLVGRVAALEERRLMAFRGAHDPGLSYQAGDCTQKGGSLHVALTATTEETPGSSGHWRELTTRAKP